MASLVSLLPMSGGVDIPLVSPDTGAGGVFDLLWLVIAMVVAFATSACAFCSSNVTVSPST